MKPQKNEVPLSTEEIEDALTSFNSNILKKIIQMNPRNEDRIKCLKEMLDFLLQVENELSTSSLLTIIDNRLGSPDLTQKINSLILLFKIKPAEEVMNILQSLNYHKKYPNIAKVIIESLEIFKREFTRESDNYNELFSLLCSQLGEEKESPLHIAAATGSSEITAFLLNEMKLAPVYLDQKRQTPLHLAKDEKTRNLLLEKTLGAIISSNDEKFLTLTTPNGENWLHYLAKLEYLADFADKIQQAAQKILSQGVSPYHRSRYGVTLFHSLSRGDKYKLSNIFRQNILFSKYAAVGPQVDKMQKFLSGILSNPSQGHFMLLSGPPGVGKTELIEALASDQKFHLIPFPTSKGNDMYLGQLNKRVTDFFDNAIAMNKPVCLLMDEMDAITPEYQGSASASSYDPNQMVNLIQTKINELQTKKTKVVLMGATNYLSKIKPAIKSRAGSNVIHFNLPDKQTRRLIIDDFLRVYKLENPAIINALAESTTGWSPRLLTIYMQDFAKSVDITLTDEMFIQSFESSRQSFMEETRKEYKDAEIKAPTLKIAQGDLGNNLRALAPEVKRALIEVDSYLSNPEPYTSRNVKPPNILLYGPAGTGKTAFARAVAEHSNALFISLSGGTFISHGSEARLKMIFELAKRFEKAVIFIDECDSITTEYSPVREILQTEMDGFVQNKNILIVIGATNYIEKIAEPAKRRFTIHVEVPLPDEKQRAELFKLFLSDPKRIDLYEDFIKNNLTEVAGGLSKQSEFLSQSDIEKLIENTARNAISTGRQINLKKLEKNILNKLEKNIGVKVAELKPAIKIASNKHSFVQNLPAGAPSSSSDKPALSVAIS